MSIESILNKIKDPIPKPIILKLYNLILSALTNQSREYQAYYLNYVLSILSILLQFNADVQTLISWLLACATNLRGIQEEIKDIPLNVYIITSRYHQLNSSKKISLASFTTSLQNLTESEEDFRAFFLHFAENFFLLNNLQNAPEYCQKASARYTLDNLIPISSKLKLSYFKSVTEDLCLSYLEPEIYEAICKNMGGTKEELHRRLNTMKESISHLLSENAINFTLKGRVKNIYSIYLKLASGKKMSEIYDYLAIRVIVDQTPDCYKVVELLSSTYHLVSNRFKDYISNPKANAYQSIHTTITDEYGHIYEIQIRTKEMNLNAEQGSASHHAYKKEQLERVKKAENS